MCGGGTQKALGYDVNPVAAALLGVLTGIGGGMMRDVLVKEIPVVLRADFCAVAALAGAAVVVASAQARLQMNASQSGLAWGSTPTNGRMHSTGAAGTND